MVHLIELALRPLIGARLRAAYWFRGIEAPNRALLGTGHTGAILSQFGATIAGPSVLRTPLLIENAAVDYRNLELGAKVHIGRGVLLDLTMPIMIEDEAVISMGTTILTHSDVGDRPLAEKMERRTAATTVGAGSYLGANVTVLPGCHIGPGAVVGAGAVVTREVPAGCVAVGVPARVVEAGS